VKVSPEGAITFEPGEVQLDSELALLGSFDGKDLHRLRLDVSVIISSENLIALSRVFMWKQDPPSLEERIAQRLARLVRRDVRPHLRMLHMDRAGLRDPSEEPSQDPQLEHPEDRG